MTFIDQFVSRSAIFQNPDHRLAQGKMDRKQIQTFGLTLDSCHLALASALGCELNKWSTFGGVGDGDLRDSVMRMLLPPCSLAMPWTTRWMAFNLTSSEVKVS